MAISKIESAGLGAGSVIQVVQNSYSTAVSTTSTSFVTSGLTATITPKFSTSKILFTGSLQVGHASATGGALLFYRDGTQISRSPSKWFYFGANNDVGGTINWSFLVLRINPPCAPTGANVGLKFNPPPQYS